jgi:hypothetical protein
MESMLSDMLQYCEPDCWDFCISWELLYILKEKTQGSIFFLLIIYISAMHSYPPLLACIFLSFMNLALWPVSIQNYHLTVWISHTSSKAPQTRDCLTAEHKEINMDIYPCLTWDSNTLPLCSSGRRQYALYTAWPLWSASSCISLCYIKGNQRVEGITVQFKVTPLNSIYIYIQRGWTLWSSIQYSCFLYIRFLLQNWVTDWSY